MHKKKYWYEQYFKYCSSAIHFTACGALCAQMVADDDARLPDEFWQQYYSGEIKGDCEISEAPSPFAQWVCSRLRKGVSSQERVDVLEVGCGNGRDALLFAQRGFRVVATDKCPKAVEITSRKLPPGSAARVADAHSLPEMAVDYAFARFVLHTITEDAQTKLFQWVKKNVRKAFYVETRSVKDPRCGRGTKVGENEYVDTHYRRFLSHAQLECAVSQACMRIEHCTEESSASGQDGAVVLRAEISPREASED